VVESQYIHAFMSFNSFLWLTEPEHSIQSGNSIVMELGIY